MESESSIEFPVPKGDVVDAMIGVMRPLWEKVKAHSTITAYGLEVTTWPSRSMRKDLTNAFHEQWAVFERNMVRHILGHKAESYTADELEELKERMVDYTTRMCEASIFSRITFKRTEAVISLIEQRLAEGPVPIKKPSIREVRRKKRTKIQMEAANRSVMNLPTHPGNAGTIVNVVQSMSPECKEAIEAEDMPRLREAFLSAISEDPEILAKKGLTDIIGPHKRFHDLETFLSFVEWLYRPMTNPETFTQEDKEYTPSDSDVPAYKDGEFQVKFYMLCREIESLEAANDNNQHDAEISRLRARRYVMESDYTARWKGI